MKIIILCGSMRFKNEMISIACELELNGYVAIQCVYFLQNKKLSDFELEKLNSIIKRLK